MSGIRHVLIVGLGSMGKRRIRNLTKLGTLEITGFDPRADRREEARTQYDIAAVESIEAGFAARPDAVVISTPPDQHVSYARQAVRRGLPFFIEASVGNDEFELLASEAERAGVV